MISFEERFSLKNLIINLVVGSNLKFYIMKPKKSLLDKLPVHKMVMNPKSYRMAHPIYS